MNIRNKTYPRPSIFLFGIAIFSGGSCFNQTEEEHNTPKEQNTPREQNTPIMQEKNPKPKEKLEPQKETAPAKIAALVEKEMQKHEAKEANCPICHETKSLRPIRCGHYACVDCITSWLVNQYNKSNNLGTSYHKDGDPIISCPECRADLSYLVPSA